MRIKLTYNGVMDIKVFEPGSEIDIRDDGTVSEVMDVCGIEERHKKYILSFVNGEEVNLARQLSEGDELSFFLPLGGG